MDKFKNMLSKAVLSVLAVSMLLGGGAIEALANTAIAPMCNQLVLRSYFVSRGSATEVRDAPGGGRVVIMAHEGAPVTVRGAAVNGWRPIRWNGQNLFILNSRLSFTSAVACLSLPVDEH
ncbi:MAG: hypothetical protein FWF59_00460 [Turicibacter sp.]|nr:hypothetical protein [Turicibacter sp.]